MKKVSHILLSLCLISSTLAKTLQHPVYIGYQDSLGQYSFGYSAPGSARSEIRQSDGQTRGSYSYVDDNGVIQSAQYTADAENGFRISATNLPQQVEDTPEVKAARAAHFEAMRLAYEREEQGQRELGQGSGKPELVQGLGQLESEQGINQPGFGQPGFGQQGVGQQGIGQPGFGQSGSAQGSDQPGSGQGSGQVEFGQESKRPGSGQRLEQVGSEQGSRQPGVLQPGIGQSGFGQAGFDQQGSGQPEFGQQGFGHHPVFTQPGFGQSGFGQPGIGRPGFGQPGFGQSGFGHQPVFTQPGVGQPGNGQLEFEQPGFEQEQDQFGESVVVEAKIGKAEAAKQNQIVISTRPKQIVGHVHTNIVSEVPEALQSPEVDAARRAYIQAIAVARAKAEGEKINYVVNDVITRVSASLGPVVQTTVSDESGVVVQNQPQTKNSQHQGQVSSPELGSFLKTQGLSQSSGIAPSTALIMKNETYPSEGFMGQSNLKDKQSPPVAGTQLYRLAVPSHISKPLVVPSTYAPIKYSSDTSTPLQQPSFAVQCFITRADQLENLVDVN